LVESLAPVGAVHEKAILDFKLLPHTCRASGFLPKLNPAVPIILGLEWLNEARLILIPVFVATKEGEQAPSTTRPSTNSCDEAISTRAPYCTSQDNKESDYQQNIENLIKKVNVPRLIFVALVNTKPHLNRTFSHWTN